MQQPSWDDLRFLLATIRGGSFSAAARTLKVDATTVARRIERLAEAAGGAVLERDGGGGLVPSERGQLLLRRAEAMERQAEMIADDLGRDAGEILGEVRVTSVPLIVNRLLVPALGALLARHPKLSVELVPESRDVDLLRREADIALRLARPSRGGLRVKAAKIGELSYAVYAPREAAASALRALPWIGYGDAMAELPQAQWIDRLGKGARRSGLRVEDVETALQAVRAGLGKTLLPRAVGDRDAGLRRLDAPGGQPFPRREVWLLGREDRLRLRSVRAVAEWIRSEVSFAP